MNVKCYALNSLLLFVFIADNAFSTEIEFDSSAIVNTNQTNASKIDLSQFNTTSNPAGTYNVTVRVNQEPVERRSILFKQGKNGELIPDLTIKDLHEFGVYLADSDIDSNIGYRIPGSLEGVKTLFNFNKLLLDINIPQAILRMSPDSDLEVPSHQWDEGINALSLNYDINGAQKKEQAESFKSDQQSIHINSGVNIGAWRLRNIGSFVKPSDGPVSWNSEKAWLQRDIPVLRSLLTIGEGNTDGALFESVDYKGVSLATDNEMFSDKTQGYAPVIHGIARTSNSRIEVTQNGNVIYQKYVPSGPFVINDLYPQSGGGELKVNIIEADGSQHHFMQSWGTVQAMQREGHLRYSINIGRTNSYNASNENFSQLTFFYGLPYEMTVFGGTMAAQDYRALDMGYALGLNQFGSLSADITSTASEKYKNGQNYRLQYSKTFTGSDTDMSLSWSFSPSDNYISLSDSILNENDSVDAPAYQKNKLQMSINQPVGELNTFTLSAWRAAYWHQNTQENLSISDNISYSDMSFSLGWAWTQSEDDDSEQQFSANVMIPFSLFEKDAWVSISKNLQRPGKSSQSIGLNGSALKDDSLAWDLNATQGDTNSTEQDINLDYKGSSGEYSSTYSHSKLQQTLSYRIKGSLIASSHGMTTGQYFNSNDAVALVDAEKVEGLKVENNVGIKTDFRGYAIVPYLQPYRQRNVQLSSDGNENSNIDLGNTSILTTPTEGAIILTNFTPHVGTKILATIKNANGDLLPFGATAIAGENGNEGIIDGNGQVYLSGAPEIGTITASWGEDGNKCYAPYKINKKQGKHLYEIQVVCR